FRREAADYDRQPPASLWREAADSDTDRPLPASFRREATDTDRQPPASSWREAADNNTDRPPPASFRREAADYERQPPASLIREAADYDRLPPASSWREATETDRQHRLRRQRRSLSADQCDAELRNNQAGRSRPRFGSVTSESRRIDQSIEMPRFDGTGDLELFIQRVNTKADYYNWTAGEKLFRLKNCIHGDAQYLLVDLVSVTSTEQFIDVLKTRFGTSAHAERYRAELGRLRRGTLTLEQLHLKVRSLVCKAAPGQWTSLTEIYARDAFLMALDDMELRRRIMLTCPPPETLVAAYDLALRASAMDTGTCEQRSGYTLERRSQPERQRYARTVTEKSLNADTDQSQLPAVQQLSEENRRLQQQLTELQSVLSVLQSKRPDISDPPFAAMEHSLPKRSAAQGLPRDVCRRCGQRGHWARECPLSQPQSKETTASATSLPTANPKANVLSSRRQKVAVYLPMEYQGQLYRALLDSGCDISVLSRRMLPDLSYQACSQKLLAANSSPIPILGSARVSFRVAGADLEYEFLVSDAVDEIILGADWLADNRCLWDFESSILWIRALATPQRVLLERTTHHSCVRRIYSKNNVELPPFSQCNVPVKSGWSAWPQCRVD
ncbi:MAG TPA: retropepsin-like aspartic protease, partial [Methylomicrobium sp.]|nr:retropepsin-like aspartic protease [Methylomicrobium sp.]